MLGVRGHLPVGQGGQQTGELLDQLLLERGRMRDRFLRGLHQPGQIFLAGARRVQRIDEAVEGFDLVIKDRQRELADEDDQHGATDGECGRRERMRHAVEQRFQTRHRGRAAGCVEPAQPFEQTRESADDAQAGQHAWQMPREIVEQASIHQRFAREEHLGGDRGAHFRNGCGCGCACRRGVGRRRHPMQGVAIFFPEHPERSLRQHRRDGVGIDVSALPCQAVDPVQCEPQLDADARSLHEIAGQEEPGQQAHQDEDAELHPPEFAQRGRYFS